MAEESRSTKDEAIRNPPSEATTQPPAEPTAEAKPLKGKEGVCSSRDADIDGTVSAPVTRQKMILTATSSGQEQKSSLMAAQSLPHKFSSKEQTSTNSKEVLKLVHKEFRLPETKQETAVASGKPLQQSAMAISACPAGAQFQASSSSTSEELATFSKKETSPASSQNSSTNKSNTPPASNKRIVKLEQDEPKSRKRKKKDDKNKQAGRWTGEEHQIFLRGLRTYGREWKKVAVHIPTRTSAQVRSHAQKYFAKLQREEQEREQQQQQQHQESHAAIGDDVNGDNGTASTSVASSSAVSDHHRIPPFRTRSAAVVPQLSALPDSVREQAERILARPESVEAEVDDTMRRLRQRYRQLQEQLQARQDRDHESSSHASSIESLHNEELIALHVLQGGLEHQQQQQEQPPRPPHQGD